MDRRVGGGSDGVNLGVRSSECWFGQWWSIQLWGGGGHEINVFYIRVLKISRSHNWKHSSYENGVFHSPCLSYLPTCSPRWLVSYPESFAIIVGSFACSDLFCANGCFFCWGWHYAATNIAHPHQIWFAKRPMEIDLCNLSSARFRHWEYSAHFQWHTQLRGLDALRYCKKTNK